MNLVNNWTRMWKSLAVILPALVAVAYALMNHFIANNQIPIEYLPVAMIISGYLGRIVKQPKL